jgi:hypothetical protein
MGIAVRGGETRHVNSPAPEPQSSYLLLASCPLCLCGEIPLRALGCEIPLRGLQMLKIFVHNRRSSVLNYAQMTG